MSCNKIIDPYGKEHKSETSMAKAFGIDIHVYFNRKGLKWTLRECLGIDKHNSIKLYNVLDPFGNRYTSEREMAEEYDVNEDKYQSRKSLGWTLRECLGIDKHINTRGSNFAKSSIDPFGNKFPSRIAMIHYYGVHKDTFNRRKKSGWTLRECLGIDKRNEKPCVVSPDGRLFSSEEAMIEAYGIKVKEFTVRKLLDWTLEECLGIRGKGLDVKIRSGEAVNPLLCYVHSNSRETTNEHGAVLFKVKSVNINKVYRMTSDQILAYTE